MIAASLKYPLSAVAAAEKSGEQHANDLPLADQHGGAYTGLARDAYVKDPEWAAPALWRSEFRNVLALYLRKRLTTIDDVLKLADEAELPMTGREYVVESSEVLRIAAASKLSAYDSEFVALAKRLGVGVVTTDDGVIRAFPKMARPLQNYVRS